MKRAKFSQWALLAILPLATTVAMANAENPPMEHDRTKADSSQPVNDTWITTKVKADLLTTDNVPGMDVKVETVNGVVTLSGTVHTQAEKDRAITTARGIEGVSRVESDNLRVVEKK